MGSLDQPPLQTDKRIDKHIANLTVVYGGFFNTEIYASYA